MIVRDIRVSSTTTFCPKSLERLLSTTYLTTIQSFLRIQTPLVYESLLPLSSSDLALPHYDTRDVSAITDIPYMVVSHDLGQCAIALSQLERAVARSRAPNLLTP